MSADGGFFGGHDGARRAVQHGQSFVEGRDGGFLGGEHGPTRAVERSHAFVEHGARSLFNGDGFLRDLSLLFEALGDGLHVAIAALLSRLAPFLQPGERLVERLVVGGEPLLELGDVFPAVGRAQGDGALGSFDLALGIADLAFEAGDLVFQENDLGVGAFVSTGQVAIVAQRRDGDEHQHGQDEVELEHAMGAVPVAREVGSRHEFSHLEAGSHDHHGHRRARKQVAQPLHGKESRHARDEQRRGDQQILERFRHRRRRRNGGGGVGRVGRHIKAVVLTALTARSPTVSNHISQLPQDPCALVKRPRLR